MNCQNVDGRTCRFANFAVHCRNMLRLNTSVQRILQKTCPNTWTRTQTRQKSLKTATHGGGSANSVVHDRSDDAAVGVEAAPKSHGKLPARPPLAKNFFLGMVDKELLAYPEILTREDMTKLQLELLPLRNFFAEEVDTKMIDATRLVPPAVLDGVQQLGLYGLNVPHEYDGKGWGWTASLMAAEAESNCTDVALGLLPHRVVIDLISEHGTLEQQQRFLGKLGRGTIVATEAVFEENVPENGYFSTTAEYETDKQSWLLHGQKAYVICGPLVANASQLFLVIAETRHLNMKGDSGKGTTIFLVDGSTPGVKVGEQHLTFGCRGLQTRYVNFDQVCVPESCVVGQPNDGNVISEILSRASRLRNSMIGLSMSKNVLNHMAHHCINTRQCGMALKDMEMTQEHLAKGLCDTYAMESMIYLSAGMLDEFNRQDVVLEAAITKYYTLTRLFKMASKSIAIVGPKALHSGQSTEVMFRNAAQLCTQGESIDTLRLFVALTGLQYAGTFMKDDVRKSRNPLFHPKHIFSKFLQTSNIDHPKSDMRLGDNLHPSLGSAAQCIEHSVIRLQLCVELLLTRYGGHVIERHGELQRIAEMATNIYSMFASASRASRSYCIGLQLADHELLVATTICANGRDMVKMLATEVFNGQFVNNDNNLQRLAKQVVKSKGFFAVHPLSFNF